MTLGLVSNVMEYYRLLGSVARFLDRPQTLAESKAVIRRRLQTREERFLHYAAQHVFGYARSPYLALLRHAGCEYGDLQTMVHQRGVERTLEVLRDEGVYVAFEEFKARKPIVRGSLTLSVAERDFDSPFRGGEMEVRTGASRSRGSPISITLDAIAENRAIAFNLMLDAAGASSGPVMTWLPGFPSGSGIFLWLGLAHVGRPPLRWFSMTNPNRPEVAHKHRMLLRTARVLGLRRGLRLPMPEFTPLSEPHVVLEGLITARDRHGECALITTPSAAVRVATLALQSNTALEHVRFLVGSEPLTPGKAQEIRKTGASVSPRYIFTEGGAAGIGCARPEAPDDMHFMADSFAVIHHRRLVPGVADLKTYMLTSLLNHAPKVMFNVESDDFGDLTFRRCGCMLDELGLHRHLANVRSFDKLTGEGARVLGTRCVQILEEVLPREFGGGSTDYQLLEAEDEHHLTRLWLVVSPEVGPVDERKLLARFVQELGRIPGGQSHAWVQAQTVRVIRRRPLETTGGKLLPFHTQALTAMRERANVDADLTDGATRKQDGA